MHRAMQRKGTLENPLAPVLYKTLVRLKTIHNLFGTSICHTSHSDLEAFQKRTVRVIYVAVVRITLVLQL